MQSEFSGYVYTVPTRCKKSLRLPVFLSIASFKLISIYVFEVLLYPHYTIAWSVVRPLLCATVISKLHGKVAALKRLEVARSLWMRCNEAIKSLSALSWDAVTGLISRFLLAHLRSISKLLATFSFLGCACLVNAMAEETLWSVAWYLWCTFHSHERHASQRICGRLFENTWLKRSLGDPRQGASTCNGVSLSRSCFFLFLAG